MFENYDDVEQFKKKAASKHVNDEDFHRFTGFLGESTISEKPRKRRLWPKRKSKTKKPDQTVIDGCIDAICENLVSDLGLGYLSDDISNIGLKFVLPVKKRPPTND